MNNKNHNANLAATLNLITAILSLLILTGSSYVKPNFPNHGKCTISTPYLKIEVKSEKAANQSKIPYNHDQ